MGDVRIRPATSSDFDNWSRLWQGYLDFYRAQVSPATVLRTWQRLLDPAEPVHAILAVVDGASVGLAHVIDYPNCWTAENDVYLQDLFVDPCARGHGIGRALIEHVYADAAVRGCTRVWWLTRETNVRAMRLYGQVAERTGFVQYRRVL
jgi:ribosomal protein S18 acetylase RimI-like enzyme